MNSLLACTQGQTKVSCYEQSFIYTLLQPIVTTAVCMIYPMWSYGITAKERN